MACRIDEGQSERPCVESCDRKKDNPEEQAVQHSLQIGQSGSSF